MRCGEVDSVTIRLLKCTKGNRMKRFKPAVAAALVIVCSTFGGWLAQRTRSVSADNTVPAGYVALTGGRIFDSRGPTLTSPRLAAGQVVTIRTGVPGATAVGVNITVTDSSQAGYVAAWPSGPWPGTSIINADAAGVTVANFALVPVAADGSFQLLTQNAAHLIVDLSGYIAGGSALVPAGFNGQITGYGPVSTITTVVGEVTNGNGVAKDIRADVRCPNGTVKIDYSFSVAPGATVGWSVICDGAFANGASVSFIEI